MSEGARTKTGILGLDEVLEGGLPRNYVHSVVGAPGAGKTVMGAQFLFRGATQYAENGVYVSLEEPTHSFANNMLRFNWNMFDLESQGKLVLLDALSSIAGVYRYESEYRYKLLQFYRALAELELTTMVLTESDTPLISKFGLETILAQGSFLLHNLSEKDNLVQTLEIQKMRGVRIIRRFLPYRVTPEGFEVRPQEQIARVIQQ